MSWPVASFAVLAVVVLAGFTWYERTRPPARVVAMVAALAALAVVGRLAFAPIPNVKPTTDIVLFAGFALGPVPGFMVGALTALVSNVFFGQGPWTAWQMVGWGGVGLAGALVAHLWRGREPSRLALALVCGAAGLAFGAFMDVYQWTFTYSNDPGSYFVVASTSLPYNLAHAAGNIAFCLLLGPAFVRALRRYRRRFDVRWAVPAVALLLLLAPSSAMASTSSKATSYLLRAQNRDGGFGNTPRASSNGLMTGWAALGLGAARKNPAYVKRRNGRTITRYLARTAGRLRDLGELERTILVLKTAGRSPRRFGGRNLVAELVRQRRGDGSFRGQVSYTAFGILALRAAGKRVGADTVAWLGRARNPDGGFGLSATSGSEVDLTGAALQALAATGRSRGVAASGAATYLRRAQNGDGGFGFRRGRTSNSQSTAYAVQGLVAVGAGRDVVGRALGYLKARQRRNGSIAYSAGSKQTPVWVTAQALAALRRKPFPLATAPKPRRRRTSRSAAAAAAAAAGAGPGGGSRLSRERSPGAATAASNQGSVAWRPVEGPYPLVSQVARTRPRSHERSAAPSPLVWAGGIALALLTAWFARRRLRAAKGARLSEKPSAG
ncbi:MAG TPA: ECF transporter S component [Thermoleophilaceae bacterium]|nr:ECF transporter S component [Thermoleophilaceae bacterium]